MIYIVAFLSLTACSAAWLFFRAERVPAAASGGSSPKLSAPTPPEAAAPQHEPVPEPEIDFDALPVLQAAPVQILDRAEIFRKLRELQLGIPLLSEPHKEHEAIVAAAIAAIGDAATQRRYSPRRPNLLPQLMRAINDDDTSRREMSALIARDPALVGSLLKMANSAYYRVSHRQVESIERAIVMLGSDGLRSLVAAALMQPIFQVSGSKEFVRFPELVWEHALRSAHAAIPHAALVERADPFAAELLCLISGLAEIVLFRAALDHCAKAPKKTKPDPLLIASLLASQSATFAWRLGVDWELSELMLAALEEQMVDSEPTTPLARSLRFGRCAGALAVLHTNSVVSDACVRLSLPDAGLSPAHLKCMWSRLLNKEHEDPRVPRRKVA